MHRRLFLSRFATLPMLALPVTAGLMLPGCSATGPLALGLHPWPGYESLHLAETFGWLPPAVSLVNTRNATETQAGLKAGTLDAGCLTLDEVLLLRAGGLPLTVIAVLNESVGADVVLARPEIGRLADLAGKRIAVEKSAVGGVMLIKLLQAAGLTSTALTVVDLLPDQQPAAWQANEIDAAICYEPVASRLEKLGGVRLFDSRQLPGIIFDVLAVRRDRIDGRRQTLKGLVAAHFRAVDHLSRSREDAFRRIGAWRQQSFAEVTKSFAGIALPNAAGNRRMLSAGNALERAARDLADIMRAGGLLPATPDSGVADLVDAAFLPELPA
ncbi:MAG: ABC transporter substrate-binding protein [Rhodocyclaceae bacterium]|nr:ABC transporter substrate-binding protein [Rhodocyclaceae bacterium]